MPPAAPQLTPTGTYGTDFPGSHLPRAPSIGETAAPSYLQPLAADGAPAHDVGLYQQLDPFDPSAEREHPGGGITLGMGAPNATRDGSRDEGYLRVKKLQVDALREAAGRAPRPH